MSASSRIPFVELSDSALKDSTLQEALHHIRDGFVPRRAQAVADTEDFEAMREAAREVRARALQDLDTYLPIFEKKVQASGGHVHWASSTSDLVNCVLKIAREHNAKTVLKGKSMVAEEAKLNEALEAEGLVPFETDLGEYIIQLAHETPSHIVVPALHKTKGQIKNLFENAHKLGERDLDTVPGIVNEARQVMRERFMSADIAVTGANLLIADTGSTVLVTNEGNGDLSATLPKVHIITAAIDKIVPTFNDAAKILRVLARSATGQPITAYTTFFNGPKRREDADGPEHFHIILLDNKRSEMLGSEFREMLQCIRCGACMNHCPVYTAVGGHAYDSVYPGPMGSVLTPLMDRHNRDHYALPEASTFCGRCAEVCPVKIPLPDLLRKLRVKAKRQHFDGTLSRWSLALYMWLIRHPAAYRRLTGLSVRLMRGLARNRGVFRRFPGAGGWTQHRNLPAPSGETFQQRWAKRRTANARSQ